MPTIAHFRLISRYRPLLRSLLLCLLVPLLSAAAETDGPGSDPNTGTIKGYVQDEQTDETLVLANVVIKETGAGTTTNKSGFFSIANVPPGAYTLVASYLGYRKKELPVTVRAGETVSLTIELVPDAVRIGEVTVEGERRGDEREITVRLEDLRKNLATAQAAADERIVRSLQDSIV